MHLSKCCTWLGHGLQVRMNIWWALNRKGGPTTIEEKKSNWKHCQGAHRDESSCSKQLCQSSDRLHYAIMCKLTRRSTFGAVVKTLTFPKMIVWLWKYNFWSYGNKSQTYNVCSAVLWCTSLLSCFSAHLVPNRRQFTSRDNCEKKWLCSLRKKHGRTLMM